MRLVLSACAAFAVMSSLVVAQSPRPSPKPVAPAYKAPRTPDGQPNLEGVWAYGTATPLERPTTLGGKAEFEDEEQAAAFQRQAVRNFDQRTPGDVGAAYNDFWWDFGKTLAGKQTSLVIDPTDGRIPPVNAEGTKRQQARAAARPARTSEADGPEDRSLWERCLTRALPTLPGPYNNNIELVQSKDHVVIVTEMIHEARIIPTDGRPHGTIGQWRGDSIGRWEGETLVVDTINFTDKTTFRGSSENLHLVERYTRIAPDVLEYRTTVSDPTTWDRSWTFSIPMARNPEGMFEYACHEGNRGLENILKGARAGEQRAAAGVK